MKTLMATLTVLLAIILVKGWIKSPTWADKTRFVMTIISIFISISFLCFIIGAWKFMEIGSSQSIFQLSICPLFIIEYVLFSLIFICFTAYEKRGFKNLKNFDEPGLIKELTGGLILSLTFILIAGLYISIGSDNLIEIFIGVVAGFVMVLFIGLINGLIEENKGEVNEKTKSNKSTKTLY